MSFRSRSARKPRKKLLKRVLGPWPELREGRKPGLKSQRYREIVAGLSQEVHAKEIGVPDLHQEGLLDVDGFLFCS